MSKRGGFTLVEVLVAIAILALTTFVLLERRLEIVREAHEIRDSRTAWLLASSKMAEIEMSKELFAGQEIYTNSGEFDEYKGFGWRCEITKEQIIIGDAKDPNNKPYEIYLVKLTVVTPLLKVKKKIFN